MFKSVSYYVQQMFTMNKGTNVLQLTTPKQVGKKTVAVPVANQEGQNGLFASAVYDKTTDEIIVKVVNTSKQPQSVSINLQGMKGERTANVLELWTNGRMEDENTLDKPEKIHPVSLTVPCTEDKKQTVLNDQLKAMSFRLYRIKR